MPDKIDIERRYLVFSDAELRIIGDEDDPVIEGYAAVYNKLSEDLGGFREKIAPNAFRNALKRTDTVMLYNHDPNYPLARVSAGTLELKEDKKGLFARAKLPRSAVRIIESIKRGDVNKMSFGFTTEKDEWEHKKNESIRTLVKVGELPDVSPVVFPAYPDTTVAVRSLERSILDLEKEKATADPTHSRGDANSSDPTHSRWVDEDTFEKFCRSKKGGNE
ncbi:MAG: HK97 family phage prohead protease [Candidatus Thorarchaeota archaeon]|jgi:HK97 family phage prohead protease